MYTVNDSITPHAPPRDPMTPRVGRKSVLCIKLWSAVWPCAKSQIDTFARASCSRNWDEGPGCDQNELGSGKVGSIGADVIVVGVATAPFGPTRRSSPASVIVSGD